jgi:hypothetical protein
MELEPLSLCSASAAKETFFDLLGLTGTKSLIANAMVCVAPEGALEGWRAWTASLATTASGGEGYLLLGTGMKKGVVF